MALFNCSECGREISDKAPACPHCGCPKDARRPEPTVTFTSVPLTPMSEPMAPKKKNRKIITMFCVTAGAVVIGALSLLILLKLPDNKSALAPAGSTIATGSTSAAIYNPETLFVYTLPTVPAMGKTINKPNETTTKKYEATTVKSTTRPVTASPFPALTMATPSFTAQTSSNQKPKLTPEIEAEIRQGFSDVKDELIADTIKKSNQIINGYQKILEEIGLERMIRVRQATERYAINSGAYNTAVAAANNFRSNDYKYYSDLIKEQKQLDEDYFAWLEKDMERAINEYIDANYTR